MSNKRKKRRIESVNPMYYLLPDSEEYRLLEKKSQKEREEYEKSKDEVEVAGKKEAFDDIDGFQKQVISMLSQILQKQNELEKTVNQINLKLNERDAKNDTVIEQTAKSQGMESAIKSRPIENLKKLESEIELIKKFLRSSQS